MGLQPWKHDCLSAWQTRYCIGVCYSRYEVPPVVSALHLLSDRRSPSQDGIFCSLALQTRAHALLVSADLFALRSCIVVAYTRPIFGGFVHSSIAVQGTGSPLQNAADACTACCLHTLSARRNAAGSAFHVLFPRTRKNSVLARRITLNSPAFPRSSCKLLLQSSWIPRHLEVVQRPEPVVTLHDTTVLQLLAQGATAILSDSSQWSAASRMGHNRSIGLHDRRHQL